MGIKKVIVGIYFLLAFALKAQMPFFSNITVNDGLTGSNVYMSIQDSKGFIWFCTETGVSQYDGDHFFNYTTANGLGGNEVFGAFEDSKGRIWFKTYNGEVSYYYDGQIYNSKTDTLLEKLDCDFFILDIFEDDHQNIWFSSSSEGVKCLLKNNSVISYTFSQVPAINMFYYDHKKRLYGIAADNEYLFEKGRFFKLNTPKDIVNFKKGFLISHQGKRRVDTFRMKEYRNLLNDEGVNAKKVSLMLEQKNVFWYSVENDGVYRKDKRKEGNLSYLKGVRINSLMEDKKGNMWFNTMGDGVYFLPKNYVYLLDEYIGLSENAMYAAAKDDKNEKLYLGSSHGSIDVIPRGDSVRSFAKAYKHRDHNIIREILIDHKSNIWAAEDKGVWVYNEEGKQIHKFKNVGAAKDITKSKDSSVIYLASSLGLYKLNGIDFTSQLLMSGRVMSVYSNEKGSVLVGTLNGLFRIYDEGKVDTLLVDNRITDIRQGPYQSIIVGTYGHGIIALDKDMRIIFSLTKKALRSNFVRHIHCNDNMIWVSTNRGLGQVRVDTNLSIINFTSYNKVDGLKDNDVLSTAVLGGKLYVNTSKGVSIFNLLAKERREEISPTYLMTVKVNKEVVDKNEKLYLEHEENNLTFTYSGISYEPGGKLNFQYKLDGLEGDWVTTRNRSVSYQGLGPGNYTFKVRTVNSKGEESDDVAHLVFVIQPHYSQTVWFRISILVLLAVLLIVVIVWRVKVFNQNAENEKKLTRLEQVALRVQMNPHFLFNSMSSIQQFINLNDKRAANKYLTKFADLMRKMLTSSNTHFHSLEEELNAIKIYIELEQLRFNHIFEFKLIVTKDIDMADEKIPPMLLQPLVENAILHGLSTMSPDLRKGLLKITISRKEDLLRIIVEDNGIGRKKSEEVKKKRVIEHDSVAMKNIKERIKLLGGDEDSHFAIEDLVDDKGLGIGTRVILELAI